MALAASRIIAASVLAGIALCVMPGAGASQNDGYAPLAQEALRRAAAPWLTRGFQPVEDVRIGVLLERERDSLVQQLDHGWEYLVLGVCDEDCTDLYFYLTDSQGKQVALDVWSGRRPLIRFKPGPETHYTLAVAIGKCAEPPCYYGVRLYRKPAPT